jgi:hypothetical protein
MRAGALDLAILGRRARLLKKSLLPNIRRPSSATTLYSHLEFGAWCVERCDDANGSAVQSPREGFE